MKRKGKKWITKAVAILMAMVFAMPMPGLKTHAEERATAETSGADVIVMNDVAAEQNAYGVRPLTTMFNCEIILAFTENGLEMNFTTSAAEISSVIGVKDIKVQQKMWYGWKTVFTSDGAENQNELMFGADLTYPDAVNGKTYRVKCVHYANYDVYEEVENDTGAFKFIYQG